MGRFITAKSRIEQCDVPGYWRTSDNELYMDDDGSMLLTPRYLWSDGYTFPGLVMAILGDHNKFDARCAHAHDMFCRYHECVKVNLSLVELKRMGYLRMVKSQIICEDIPIEYLDVQKVTKKWADDTFKRMMLSCKIPLKVVNTIRFGVAFNLNWYLRTGKKSILEYDIFNEDLGLVNGI